jgi:hypothetical protein
MGLIYADCALTLDGVGSRLDFRVVYFLG